MLLNAAYVIASCENCCVHWPVTNNGLIVFHRLAFSALTLLVGHQ